MSEIDGNAMDFSPAANRAAVVPAFAEKFGRPPLPPEDPRALLNDLVFARMIDPDWSPLARAMVDKVSAKEEAVRLCPGLRTAPTVAVIAMDGVDSPLALFDRLRPFAGRDLVAKPAQASGGIVFLRGLKRPANVATLHALATHDYAGVMREMQYAGLPRRVIVETLIPTRDGQPPDDLKFHCIGGEPIWCQVDHARFGGAWSRIFGVPEFAPMDPDDGLVMPAGMSLPSAERRAAMVAAARALSAPFDYVRVDLYDGLDGIVFGELTFTPAASLGIAPSALGSHRETETHRRFSRALMDAWRKGREGGNAG
ncbi:hypothetical protein GCM10022281_25240 [Sphingomonas rosea]|uniref:Teichuronopeptide biosynthesis TupA-like protein n=1 Tax=Sphingomonas rosea TaxID=335605 RepID=A0ABP7UGP1_9SPHN